MLKLSMSGYGLQPRVINSQRTIPNDHYKQKMQFCHLGNVFVFTARVSTIPGKPGKMTVAFPVMEISWNLKIMKNIMEK